MAAAPRTSQNKLVRWIDHRLPIFTFLDHELNEYPTPRNLNYWWNFGSLAGIMLMIMIVDRHLPRDGLHAATSTIAFEFVERIMRDVN